MNKPSSALSIVLLIAVVLTALFLYWLVPKIESYIETEDLGFSAEAYSNPYLAAQQYLEKLGKPVSSSDSLESMRELPGIETSLVINDISQVLTEERTYELLDWIARGGRLVMGASGLDEDDVDYLLQAVEIEVIKTDCQCGLFEGEIIDVFEDVLGKKATDGLRDEFEEIEEEINAEIGEEVFPETPEVIPDAQLTRMSVPEQDQELTLHFDPNYALYTPYWDWYEYALEDETFGGYEPDYWAGSDYGKHFVQFDIGDGVLTVLSDESIWFSENLSDYDHAYLLWSLHRHSGEVMFVYGSRMPGLFTLLWKNASELVISMLALLFAWLIYKGRRFGPIQTQDPRQRRALLEHQQAVGQFMWQRQQALTLLDMMRADLMQRLRKRYPDFEKKTLRQQCEHIEKTIQVPAQESKLALHNSDEINAELFTEVTAAIQTIRNRL